MRKIEIDGEQYVSVRDLRDEMRTLRRNIPETYRNFKDADRAMVHLAYNDIIKAVYREELSKAKTPDEIRSVIAQEGRKLNGIR